MDASENLQTQLLDIPDENFDAIISTARAKRETKALRAGFPLHLADLASYIRVIRPKRDNKHLSQGGSISQQLRSDTAQSASVGSSGPGRC
ncbi:hypothetical protein PILCRDRAFT_810889 [Piloderma croceum F 1598]|uniref:Uncharacterized protein n=1 Tax=Piloderma croceum (strain F 1598) TaxID=765440 RepID=A0A0C3G5W7_PILCF|nr:hypothetical protein PILCRDRAFT_810889 [Piloderma croceum F 1598]